MHMSVAVASALVFVSLSCKESPSNDDAPAPKAVTPAPDPAPAATPEPAAAPPPTPVALTAEQLNPSCARLLPVEIASQAFGADEVTSESDRLAICSAKKGGEVVGSLTVACRPELDVSTFGGERSAMTKARDLEPMVGRAGYRLGAGAFFVLDDDTPCRLQIMFAAPDEAAWPAAIRAIMAQVSPANLE